MTVEQYAEQWAKEKGYDDFGQFAYELGDKTYEEVADEIIDLLKDFKEATK